MEILFVALKALPIESNILYHFFVFYSTGSKMDPKEYLRQYLLYKTIATAYKKTAQAAEQELVNVKLNVKYYELREKTRQYAAILRTAIKECETKSAAAVQIYSEVMATIENVPDPTERQLLMLRYIDGLKWDDIADQLHYSLQHIHNIHNKSLEHIPLPDC